MKIYEYQAKALFREFHIPSTAGAIIQNVAAVPNVLKNFPQKSVLKAQIHAGGRGKGVFRKTRLPGVFMAPDPKVAEDYIRRALGNRLITAQTDPKGEVVQAIYVCEALNIKKEYYLAFMIDRNKGVPVCVTSEEGGVNIEETVASDKRGMHKIFIDPEFGPHDFQMRALAKQIHLAPKLIHQWLPLIKNCYYLFCEKDASLIEINPLVETEEGLLIVADAKMAFDDHALFKHPDIKKLKDINQGGRLEEEARSFGIHYIKAQGEIACIVNGAGLALATMDVLRYYGGKAANFLDLGGESNQEQIVESIKLVASNDHAKGLFINIFGGIAQCDVVAKGILEGFHFLRRSFPIVVRLEGARAEEGQQLLRKRSFQIVLEQDFDTAVQKIIQLTYG